MVSVAIIGASGIGAIHAREFLHAGATLSGILGRTPESTNVTAIALSKRLGVAVRPFSNLAELLNSGVNIVAICSPPDTHRNFIEIALRAGLFVFCEKPLYWDREHSLSAVAMQLRDMETLAYDHLALNVANSYLLRQAISYFELSSNPQQFHFEFLTRGPYQNLDIGIDLLPHAFSLAQVLRPDGGDDVSVIEKTVEQQRFTCRLLMSGLECEFFFELAPQGPKRLSFTIDDCTVTRVTQEENGRFQIYLKSDLQPHRLVPVEDPFRVSINNFVGYVLGKNPLMSDLSFAFAQRNIRLMTQTLL